MDNQFCKKCESENIVLETFEYLGDYASHNYICLDCKHQGTFYYDVKYTITNNYFIKNETKKTNQKEKT